MKKSIFFVQMPVFAEREGKRMEISEVGRQVSVSGLSYFGEGCDAALAAAVAACREGRPFAVFTPGATVAARAAREASLSSLLRRADLLLPDGKGVSLAARLCGSGRLSAVAGIDFAERLMARMAEEGGRVFLYGGREGVAARAAERLGEKYPALLFRVADGYGEDPWERAAAHRPQIVCVGLGVPRQEAWIAENKHRVGGVMIGVGGALDVWSGDKRRAPALLRRAGLEWAWRTLLEPKRFPRLLPLPRYYLTCLRFRQNAKKTERKHRRV